jgi:hypothetical protein
MIGTKKAAGLTAARTTKQQAISYQSCAQQSIVNLKEKIGLLLLRLQSPLSQDQQKECWCAFESLLRRYVEVKYCEV